MLIFLVGISLAVLIAWLYTSWLPERPDFDRWEALYRLAFYGLVLMGVLVAIKVVPTSKYLAKAISWPFSSIKGLLPQPDKPWQWLELIGGATLLGIVASVISFFVTQSTQETTLKLQDKKERQELLTNYMNDMTQLIKAKSYKDMSKELKVAISTRTLNTLEALEGDGSRQGYVLRFASRAFPDFTCGDKFCGMPSNISLRKISLKGFEIDNINGIPKDLFEGADLRGADLEASNLTGASLQGANMEGTILRRATFGSQGFRDARFTGSDLEGSMFKGSDLTEVRDLDMARFSKDNPTRFSSDTKFNHKFLSKICELRKQDYIRFNDWGVKPNLALDSKKKLKEGVKTCDPFL